MIDLSTINGFDWDAGNVLKNLLKHFVTRLEAEQVFANMPKQIKDDEKHSNFERRFHILGQSNDKRLLHLTFTLRNNRIRVISARPMSKKDRVDYGKLTAV